jgi:uncharacterized protein (UPF0276 family)
MTASAATHPQPQLQSLQTPALPVGAGVCLKAQHYTTVLAAPRNTAFLEVHAENYLHAGGPAHRYLEAIRADHRLSIHGVGLSLAGPTAPAPADLAARRALIDRYQPDEFSEHLAWVGLDGQYFNDLLPIAYTGDSLARVAANISATQDALGRRILIENPATYLQFASSTWSETQFLNELVTRTGCGLLLDVNNIVVCAANHDLDPLQYLRELPLHAVGEIHLAGHTARTDSAGHALLIDSHDGPVQQPTWDLYAQTLSLTGAVPTLIEWDSNLPQWSGLMQEAAQAAALLRNVGNKSAYATG